MKKLIVLLSGLLLVINCYSQQEAKAICTNSEADIIPEGIAVNTTNGTIYVTSIARKKILAIDENGKCSDFIKSNKGGFLQGLGIKVDEKKHWLWVVSNEKQGIHYISKIHAFDIRTNKVKQQYSLEDTTRHLFNDLTLDTSGKIYVTDTYGSSVYEVDPSTRQFHLFISDSLIAFPNGIASNNKGKIYIATYSHGLMQLDLASKTLAHVKGYTDSVKVFSLDGILYYHNTIIGVYNGAENNSNNAIVQYTLNSEGDKIINERTIDMGNRYFHEPTTVGISRNRIYVVANSYLAAFNANKESVEGIKDKLGPVVVLVYDMK